MAKDLLGAVETDMKQIRHNAQEVAILRRCPFHEAPTRAAALNQFSAAIRLLFEIVPEGQWAAVMGRLDRKLIKRMHYFKNNP